MKLVNILFLFQKVTQGDRCAFSDNFVRHCGDPITSMFDLTAHDCLAACSAHKSCTKAHHHPGNQIWENDNRTSCWLWDEDATPCDWKGGELIDYHPGATMIRCSKPTQCDDIKGETGYGKFEIFPFGNSENSLLVFCDFNPRQLVPAKPARTYLNLDPETNYSKWTERRLHDSSGHLCSSSLTQTNWELSGFTKFQRIRLSINSEGVTIDRSDPTFSEHTAIHFGGSKSPKPYGTAGDCYSWNECSDAREGHFKIDLSGDENGVEIDWTRTGDWKANAWGNGNFIVNFKKTKDSVSARCGGWCGDCEPSTPIYLVPKGTAPDRNPAVVLEKLVKRFKTFMNDNLPKNTKFVSSINAKLERLSARMTAKYQMLNTKCEIWNEPKDDEETNLRYDTEDACKAANQLPNALTRWANTYNVNCITDPKHASFADRIQPVIAEIKTRLTKKLQNC